jgi:hypothetical protein
MKKINKKITAKELIKILEEQIKIYGDMEIFNFPFNNLKYYLHENKHTLTFIKK